MSCCSHNCFVNNEETHINAIKTTKYLKKNQNNNIKNSAFITLFEMINNEEKHAQINRIKAKLMYISNKQNKINSYYTTFSIPFFFNPTLCFSCDNIVVLSE